MVYLKKGVRWEYWNNIILESIDLDIHITKVSSSGVTKCHYIVKISTNSEDELSSKQTEVSGLKNSVAELSSSRAGLEANYQNTTAQLETAKTR